MRLYYNGTDIYDDVSVNYCVYEMYAEGQADTLVIRFNDPKGTWSKWNPAAGDEIRLTEGAADTGKMFLHSMKPENGLYTIRAMSMPRSGTVKKSRSWEGVRFLQLGHELAANNGLTFESYGCTDQVYAYLKQENEGDIALFSRLCTLESCQMLIYDGKLISYSEPYIESMAPKGALEVDEGGVFAYHDDRANAYGSCEISCGRYAAKFDAPDAVSSAILRPDRELRITSNAEAGRFARGLLRNANKYGRRGQFTKALLTDYAAASMLQLKTSKASTWDGPVFIYKVRHDFVANKTTLYFRNVLEGY